MNSTSHQFDSPLTPQRPGVERHQMLHCEVDRLTYRNDENGWSVLKVRTMDDQSPITVTGHLPSFHEGEQLQLVGSWSSHPTYGRQFKADRATTVRPSTRAAILRYLSSGHIKGIGEKTATRIVEHFGLETFTILDENPGCLLQVPKLGKKKAKEIIHSWRAQRAMTEVMVFLTNLGLTLPFCFKITKIYGEETIDRISTNPYQLAIDINGIGFIKADAIAKNVGISPESPERMRAAILHHLMQSEERGHCYQTTTQIGEALLPLLGLSAEQIDSLCPKQLEVLRRSGALISERLPQQTIGALEGLVDELIYWRPDLLAAERDVSNGLVDLLKAPLVVDDIRVDQWLNRYAEITSSQLSPSQRHAVVQASKNRVFILTGGPGVGKTTTANAIIRLFKAMGKSVLLAAPTGRAAQRLSEVAAEKAKTIHRLLEWQPAEGGFSRNETNPLVADVIICDESSMLDIRLASALVSAVSKRSQLIFIGDVDQLPSVGPGNVLRDLIQSTSVPFIKLTEIFRQAASSYIIRYAHEINTGTVPIFENTPKSDCQFIEIASSDDIRSMIKTLVYDVLPKRHGFDPKKDIQVLSPMNRGDLGTVALNLELQELLNPDPRAHIRESHQKAKGGELRPGDKVIQMVNNYELQVFNGDIGYVIAANVEGGKTKVEYNEGRIVTYDHMQVEDLRLAYAITIHKSQGSEFPVVILPMSMQHYVMLQRNLVYTGLTRAKKLAIFIGSKRGVAHAVLNTNAMNRQTTLAYRLQKDLLS